MDKTAKKPRLKLYGRIHSLMGERNVSDEAYRDILWVNFQVESKSDLSERQLLQLVNHLEGVNPPQPPFDKGGCRKAGGFPGKPRNFEVPERAASMRKIEACLTERKLPWAYATSMAKRICKRDALELCSPEQLHKLVQAFGYDARRKGLRK